MKVICFYILYPWSVDIRYEAMDRFRSGIWQGGTIWPSANVECLAHATSMQHDRKEVFFSLGDTDMNRLRQLV